MELHGNVFDKDINDEAKTFTDSNINQYFANIIELYENQKTQNMAEIIDNFVKLDFRRNKNVNLAITILDHFYNWIEKFSAKLEFLALSRIILLKLLESDFIKFLKQNFEFDDLLCPNLKLLNLISNQYISFKYTIISKFFDQTEEDDFCIYDKCLSWNIESFDYLLEICLYELDSPKRKILLDASPIIKLLNYLFVTKINLFCVFIKEIRKNVLMDIFNIDILESHGFSDSILTFVNKSKINLFTNDLIELLCSIFQHGITHLGFTLLMRFIYKTIFDLDENIHQFRLFIFKLISENQPSLLTYWNFYNYNKKDNFSVNNLEAIDYAKGISLFFIMRIYEPFHVDNFKTLKKMPLLWISSESQPSSGLLLVVSPNNTIECISINNGNRVESLLWNINKNFLNDTKIMMSLKKAENKFNIAISSTIEDSFLPLELNELFLPLNDPPILTFGYYPLSTTDRKMNDGMELKISQNFVGRLGSICCFNSIIDASLFRKLDSEHLFHNFSSLTIPKPLVKQCIFAFDPENSFENKSLSPLFQNKIAPTLNINDISNYRKITFSHYYNHYYGNIILLTLFERICIRLKNDVNILENERIYYLSLAEKISLTFINSVSNSSLKLELEDLSLLSTISKFHYLLFLYRDIKKLITINLTKMIYDNLHTRNRISSSGSSENTSLWMPFLNMFRDSDIWSHTSSDVQSMRMQLYHCIAARCAENNSQLIFDVAYLLSYLEKTHENPLKLNSFELSSIESSIFSLVSFTLVNFYDKNNIHLLFKFFIENKYVELDVQAIDIVQKLLSNNKINDDSDFSLLSNFICKLLQNRDNDKIQLIFDFVVNLSTNIHINKIIPTHIWVAFFCRVFMDFTLNEDDIFNISQILFSFLVIIKKQNSSSYSYMSSVFIWSFLLIQRLNLKKRAIMITRLTKIILPSNFIPKQPDKLIPLMFLMQIPLWKSIPLSLFSVFSKIQGIKNFFNDTSQYLDNLQFIEQSKEHMTQNCTTVTIVEQVALLYLSLYKYHGYPLEFLLFPIFSIEIIGNNMSILPGISVQVIILTIYLKTVYAFDQKINVKCYEDADLCIYINMVEVTVHFLLELDISTVSNLNDSNLENLSECISFLSQVIVKHLSFSRHHLKLPLMVIIKFMNLCLDNVIIFFSGLLENSLELCNPNFNHIACTLSCLYKLYQDEHISKLSRKTILIYVKKIGEKYHRLIEEEGLGILSHQSPYDFDENDKIINIDNIHINCQRHSLAFDGNVWRQIKVRSEEHPLSVKWLTNPASICLQMRSQTSKYFGSFINNLEENINLFYSNTNPHLSEDSFKTITKIKQSVFLHNNISINWNIERSNILQYLFDEDPKVFGLKKHLFVQRSENQCIYPAFLSDDEININSNPLLYIKNYYRYELHNDSIVANTLNNKSASTDKSSFKDVSFRCRFKLLCYTIDGKITQKYNHLEFIEDLDSKTHDLRNIYHLPLSFRLVYNRMKECYLRKIDLKKLGLEIYLSNKTSLNFIFNKETDLDIFMSNFCLINNPNIIFNLYGNKLSFEHDLSITGDWVTGKISHLKYIMFLNKLSGSSFNDLTRYPFFPYFINHLDQKVEDNLILNNLNSIFDCNQSVNNNQSSNRALFSLKNITILSICESLDKIEPFSTLYDHLRKYYNENTKVEFLFEFIKEYSLLFNLSQSANSTYILDYIFHIQSQLSSDIFAKKLPVWIDHVFGPLCNENCDKLVPLQSDVNQSELGTESFECEKQSLINSTVHYPVRLFESFHPTQQTANLKYYYLARNLTFSPTNIQLSMEPRSNKINKIRVNETILYFSIISLKPKSPIDQLYQLHVLTENNIYVFTLSMCTEVSYIANIFGHLTLQNPSSSQFILEEKIPLPIKIIPDIVKLKKIWDNIRLMSSSKDGKWLVVWGFSDNSLRIYHNHILVFIYRSHLHFITCADFCLKSNYLISASNDGTCSMLNINFYSLRSYENNSLSKFLMYTPVFTLCFHKHPIIYLKAHFSKKFVLSYDITHKLNISSLLTYDCLYSLDNSSSLIHGITLKGNIYQCDKGVALIHNQYETSSILLKINAVGEILDKLQTDSTITHINIFKSILFIIFDKRKLIIHDIFNKFTNPILSYEFKFDIQRIYTSLDPYHYLCYTFDNKFIPFKITQSMQ